MFSKGFNPSNRRTMDDHGPAGVDDHRKTQLSSAVLTNLAEGKPAYLNDLRTAEASYATDGDVNTCTSAHEDVESWLVWSIDLQAEYTVGTVGMVVKDYKFDNTEHIYLSTNNTRNEPLSTGRLSLMRCGFANIYNHPFTIKCYQPWKGHVIIVVFKSPRNVRICEVTVYEPGVTCDDRPCIRDTCSMRDGEFFCNCATNHTGALCEADVKCGSKLCKNGATCEDVDGGFTCHCPQYYVGRTCNRMTTCYDRPCQNSALCRNTDMGAHCICDWQYAGNRCEKKLQCVDLPCMNGATCVTLNNRRYMCRCGPLYKGDRCETAKYPNMTTTTTGRLSTLPGRRRTSRRGSGVESTTVPSVTNIGNTTSDIDLNPTRSRSVTNTTSHNDLLPRSNGNRPGGCLEDDVACHLRHNHTHCASGYVMNFTTRLCIAYTDTRPATTSVSVWISLGISIIALSIVSIVTYLVRRKCNPKGKKAGNEEGLVDEPLEKPTTQPTSQLKNYGKPVQTMEAKSGLNTTMAGRTPGVTKKTAAAANSRRIPASIPAQPTRMMPRSVKSSLKSTPSRPQSKPSTTVARQKGTSRKSGKSNAVPGRNASKMTRK